MINENIYTYKIIKAREITIKFKNTNEPSLKYVIKQYDLVSILHIDRSGKLIVSRGKIKDFEEDPATRGSMHTFDGYKKESLSKIVLDCSKNYESIEKKILVTDILEINSIDHSYPALEPIVQEDPNTEWSPSPEDTTVNVPFKIETE
ncbi:MAG: hypothetical protein PHC62_00210 [Candidatus Izemoplasmatales bacterium]|nr:hypothetical protein [Candidatus Izemoplasmatales bacterium]